MIGKLPSRKIDLVIFDFDGTLVDTAPDLIRAANKFLRHEGLETLPEDRIRSHIGMGLRKLLYDLYPAEQRDEALSPKIEKDFLEIYEKELLRSPTLFPGTYEFLTEWDGQIAIVSNKRTKFITPILKHLGLDTFPWVRVIGGDTYPNMKPHPEPFLGAITAAGSDPEATLIVGDGTPDVAGSLAIGSRCVVVEHGYQPTDELMDLGAWTKIESFHDLLPLINSIT